MATAGRQDPVSLRSERRFRLFGWYLRHRFRRSFHAVRLSGAIPHLPGDRPVIVFSNHPSWWDPALYIVLAGQLFPGRPGFGPMDAAALDRYRFFRRLGIFGIEKNSRAGSRRFLEVARRVLGDARGENGRAMLWVTAEGDFTDPRTRPLRLRPGIAHLARIVPDALLLPLAIEYVFWNESRPEVLARFGPAIDADPAMRAADWGERLQDALSRQMDQLAVDAMHRDPAHFAPMLRGRIGSALPYDLYRRFRARLAGTPFSAAHQDEQA